MFKSRNKKPVHMVRVCEACYVKAPLVDRILMVMVANGECEMRHK